MLDLTKTERRQKTLELLKNASDFIAVRQELMTHIGRGGAYNTFMKGRGYDSETWETIVMALKAVGVLSANPTK
jgi:hypothetical protein